MLAHLTTTILVTSLLYYHVTQSVPVVNSNHGHTDVIVRETNTEFGGSQAGRIPSSRHPREQQSVDRLQSVERVPRATTAAPPRDDDLIVDLRAHKLFMSNPRLDCCPTLTQLNRRSVGINPHGLVLELFQTENFTQAFYETMCDPTLKDRPCQFIESNLAPYSRCVQQWSYVYAMGRTFGHFYEQFRFDYIRVATGCKCQLPASVAKQRGAADQRQSVVLVVPSMEDSEP